MCCSRSKIVMVIVRLALISHSLFFNCISGSISVGRYEILVDREKRFSTHYSSQVLHRYWVSYDMMCIDRILRKDSMYMRAAISCEWFHSLVCLAVGIIMVSVRAKNWIVLVSLLLYVKLTFNQCICVFNVIACPPTEVSVTFKTPVESIAVWTHAKHLKMKVKVKSWTAVGTWQWVSNDDTCGICRMSFEACCPECLIPGDDCPLVWGECTHCFHIHCIVKWLGSQQQQQQCPMCRQDWKFKEWEWPYI